MIPDDQALPAPPADAWREAHMRCILDHWLDIAALAWEGYQREGRGVVALWMRADTSEDIRELIYISEHIVRTHHIP